MCLSNRVTYAAGLVLAMLTLAGCKLGGSAGGVAVLDLDAVAKAAGRDAEIAEQVRVYAREQEAKLQELKSELEQQVTSASEKLGEDASAADKQSLSALVINARSQLTRELGQARQSAQQLRQRLVNEFAKEIQPLAQRAAEARGMTVVMLKQPGLLVVMPQADITQAVIDALQSGGTSVAPALPDKG